MNIRVLGAFGSEGPGQRPSAFLVNDRTLVDAGSVSGALPLAEQLMVEDVLLTHAHLDHVVGAAYLAETFATSDVRRTLTVASLAPVIEAVRGGIFNNTIWPDFSVIPGDAPAVTYRALAPQQEHRVGGLRVIPVPVDHTVPTAGFIVHDGVSGFVYSGDTGPTEALWKFARMVPGIRAVLIECAFPSRLEGLANISRHMTPARLQREREKMPPDVPILVYHIKPQFTEETGDELARLGGDMTIVEQDKTYTLS
jgi:ribonuclease BN (tRNA processing enzyme)